MKRYPSTFKRHSDGEDQSSFLEMYGLVAQWSSMCKSLYFPHQDVEPAIPICEAVRQLCSHEILPQCGCVCSVEEGRMFVLLPSCLMAEPKNRSKGNKVEACLCVFQFPRESFQYWFVCWETPRNLPHNFQALQRILGDVPMPASISQLGRDAFLFTGCSPFIAWVNPSTNSCSPHVVHAIFWKGKTGQVWSWFLLSLITHH